MTEPADFDFPVPADPGIPILIWDPQNGGWVVAPDPELPPVCPDTDNTN